MINDLSTLQWVIYLTSGLLIGMSKTGVQGIGTLVVPMLVFVFGGKPSTGVLLPILCMADIIAVSYYRRSGNMSYVIKLLPWAITGFFLALVVDRFIPVDQFKWLIGFCIFLGLIVLLWSERFRKNKPFPTGWGIAALFGVMGGFTTMIGNAAGPIMAVYLLAMRLPKKEFVGVGAWFFLVVNLLKLPLQIWAWDNITWESFSMNLLTLPFIILGGLIGIKFVKVIPETWFRRFVIVVTFASSLLLFL